MRISNGEWRRSAPFELLSSPRQSVGPSVDGVKASSAPTDEPRVNERNRGALRLRLRRAGRKAWSEYCGLAELDLAELMK